MLTPPGTSNLAICPTHMFLLTAFVHCRSGLDFGDQILNINGVDVAGMGPSAVQSMLNFGDKVHTDIHTGLYCTVDSPLVLGVGLVGADLLTHISRFFPRPYPGRSPSRSPITRSLRHMCCGPPATTTATDRYTNRVTGCWAMRHRPSTSTARCVSRCDERWPFLALTAQ
jgi:hypothetical protein